MRWREEGAQIIGGCCGVRPEHIAAARERLDGTRPGHRRPPPSRLRRRRRNPPRRGPMPRGRSLYPLPFPKLDVEPGVVAPAPPSFMAWRHLFAEGIGAGRRCLDVGCGTGILGVQLALNHAAHVHCIDIDERAVVEHARQRVPQRRRRPPDRRHRRPLSVGAGGALRGRRGLARPAADRPVPERRHAPPRRLLGADAARPADRQAAGRARARGHGLHRAALDRLAAAHRRAAGRGRARGAGRGLRAVPAAARLREPARRSSASRRSATPTTSRSATSRRSPPTCWRSATSAEAVLGSRRSSARRRRSPASAAP